MGNVEYDRFGPWILEINDVDRIPPVFEPYAPGGEPVLLQLKIPRPVERRNLRPGDHMYDYLLTLFDDRIEILVRDAGEARRFVLTYADIVAVRHREDLLDGHLVMFTPEIAYDLPYSTVSVDLMERLLGILRERYIDGDRDQDDAPAKESDRYFEDGQTDSDTSSLSFLFAGLARKREEHLKSGRLFALQDEVRMIDVDRRILHRVFNGAVEKRLLESLHFVNDRELKIITRGRSWAYRWQAVYARETLYIPLDRLRSIDESPQAHNRGVAALTMATAASSHEFIFLENNPGMARYRTIFLK